MKNLKFPIKKFFISLAILIAIAPATYAEPPNPLEVTKAFIDEIPIDPFFWDFATSNDKDLKLIVLAYIEDEIEKTGDKFDVVVRSLTFLISEHKENPIIVDGRISNDYPDIRIKAIKCLESLGTMQAFNILIEMLTYEENKTVRQELINSLERMDMPTGY